MMKGIEPIARQLVLVGGGHSHVLVLKMLGMNPIPGLKVILISPDILTPYSGMLPGVVAGHYSADEIHIDLVPLCRFSDAVFIQSRVSYVDTDKQTLVCDNWPDISYDVLSLDIGITPALDTTTGAKEFVSPVKPIGQFLNRWHKFTTSCREKTVSSVGFVGAGAGGVELALAARHSLGEHIKVHLFTADECILASYPAKVQSAVTRQAESLGIQIHTKFRVCEVKEKSLISESGSIVEVDEIFWVTGAASQSWLADTNIDVDKNGFVTVKDTLQSTSVKNVFACGDIAHVLNHPRPKAGVYAVRQGPILYENIVRLLFGEEPKPFTPQDEFLSLLSMGGKYAVASKRGFQLEGKWVWQWKNWIDQQFMKRFTKLPEMKTEKAEGLLAEFDEQMRCGGCGSKVSADILSEVLEELGLGYDGLDDAAVFKVPEGKLMLHTVDAFKAFIDDAYTFARIAAQHALSDIYAMGGDAATALVSITVPYGKPHIIKATLSQILAGTKNIFDEQNIGLVGGHTTEGSELSISITVNGLLDPDKIMRKAGLKTGDILILSKALGTGILFAADMQHKAKGVWIESALKSMLQSNAEAADIFKEAQVSSCTDVTGFGLAGHLSEMLDASDKGALINLDSIPILDGAKALFHDHGIGSTLHLSNQNSITGISPSEHPAYPLIFDPQTSGGLLVGISASMKDKVLSMLIEAGYTDAVCIGEVCEGSGISFS